MRAIHFTRYGPPEVLHLVDAPQPVPKRGQLLIRVHAASVTLGDCEIRAFKLPGWIWLPARIAFGIFRPRNPVLGQELSGEIIAIGEGVTRFKPGDRVFGATGFHMGAYAEYAVLPEKAVLTAVPDNLTHAEAVGIPVGGLNALHFIGRSAIAPGERVLINGAGGAIGLFAVQLAKRAGAEVTAVDSADKHDMLRDLGASHVIDYRTTDFWATGARYDVVIDIIGLSPFAATVKAINDGGRYVLGNPQTHHLLPAIAENRRKRIRVLLQPAGERVEDLADLVRQVADGSLRVIIDRTLPLEVVPEAQAYVEAGHKRGILVIDVSGEATARP